MKQPPPLSSFGTEAPRGRFLDQIVSATAVRGQIPASLKMRLCHPTVPKTLGHESEPDTSAPDLGFPTGKMEAFSG